MRKLTCRNWQVPAAECIGRKERTWGTETSKYPQEKRKTFIPSVAASEIGTAQTRVRPGVVDALRSYKTVDSRSLQECCPTEGERPVDEIDRSPLRGVPE